MTSYFGGKGSPGVFQTLINQIPPHKTYVSAFAGLDHVLQNIRPASRTVVLDLDPSPLEWWALPRGNAEIYQADAVAWIRHELQLDAFRAQDVGNCVARGPMKLATLDPATPAAATPSEAALNRDPSSYFFLIDPPYPSWTRTSATRYQCEADSLADHERILETAIESATQPGVFVMVCSYPNEFYDATLQGWRTVDYYSTVRSGERRLERVWMNYPEPIELHDYRYLGGDKREREKIRRRARNLVNGLKSRPDQERLAMLQYLADEFGDRA